MLPKRVLGESISPNEASGTLGKWLATCVPRHYENKAFCFRFPADLLSDFTAA